MLLAMFASLKTVNELLSLVLKLRRFSAGTLRQALRKSLKSQLARNALESEGVERDSPLRPDGTSSRQLLAAHGHCIFHGSAPQPSSIKVSRVMAIHKSTCDLCSAKPWNASCLYTNWLKSLSNGYFPAMHGPPKLVREIPILASRISDATIIDHSTDRDPNYKSFIELGSYSHAAISELIDGNILMRLDEFKPARSVFARFPWIRQVRSCSLGMVMKKRDIAYGLKIGLDITQEGGSKDFDAHLARSGLKPPKRRLILDPTRAGINAEIKKVPFSYPKRSDAEAIIRKGDWLAKTDLQAYFHQFPLAPEATCLFNVSWLGAIYGFLRCPFGIASLPYFCSVMSAFLSEHLWKMGLDHAFLLDDFFTRSSSLEEVKVKIARINEFIRSLGFPVQESKVEYGQSLTFLGIVYDTLAMTTRVDPSAAIGTLHVIRNHIMPHLHKRGNHWTTDPLSTYETSLASLTGTLNWFCETMASGRSRLGSLYTLSKFGSRIINLDRNHFT